MEKKERSYTNMMIDKGFYNTVQKFIQDYEKHHGFKISCSTATKIINDKIINQGGLKVD